MASFTSLEFIFRFLPIFILLYVLIPARYKNAVMLLGSLVFYAFGEPVYIIVLVALILINFLFSHFSFMWREDKHRKSSEKGRKNIMVAAVAIDVLTLAAFKGIAIFVDSSVFPLGLSFYIFKMISFQIDVMRGEIEIKPTFIQTATYFSMFPQIAQGPIMRYEEGELFNDKKLSWAKAEEGLRLFVIGLAMKVILADRIGILWNDLGMYGYQSISTPLAWMGAFAYSFELYFDFWGYSLMASGMLVAFGYEFIKNFDHPYASKTVSEFYRRWHMTLGSFFRDYVYFPLGGSRTRKPRTVFNLAVVWILTGIWHGNGLNFLLWGGILGLLVILEKCFYGKWLQGRLFLGNLYIIVIIPLTWVVFAINNLTDLGIYFGRLFPFFGTSQAVVDSGDFLSYLKDYGWMFIVSIPLCVPGISKLYAKVKDKTVTNILLMILFWISIYFSASSSANPFMYLNF